MIFIDLILLISLVMPTQHQTLETVKYMEVAMNPLNDVQTLFYAFFDEVKYDLQFDGRVIYLERLLNDLFDPTNRDIYISDAPVVEQLYLFNQIEDNEPTILSNVIEDMPPVYVYNSSEAAAYDFYINIPVGVTFNADLIAAKMAMYVHAGKRYKIKTF